MGQWRCQQFAHIQMNPSWSPRFKSNDEGVIMIMFFNCIKRGLYYLLQWLLIISNQKHFLFFTLSSFSNMSLGTGADFALVCLYSWPLWPSVAKGWANLSIFVAKPEQNHGIDNLIMERMSTQGSQSKKTKWAEGSLFVIFNELLFLWD